MDEEPGRQAGWQELIRSECFALLAREHLGRVAVVDDHGPVVFPVNFVVDRHMVVFRTDDGTKLDAACRGSGSRSRSMGLTLRLDRLERAGPR